jgi:hypothetical protein
MVENRIYLKLYSETVIGRINVFCDVMLCGLAEVYQCFGTLCSLHLQDRRSTLKMEAAHCSETSINFCQTIKFQTQKRVVSVITLRTSNLISEGNF